MRFEIHEGPPTIVTNVSVAFDSTVIPVKRATANSRSYEPGERLDLFEIDSTRISFQNELWERGLCGRARRHVERRERLAHTARVRFQLVPNHLTTVGNIAVRGTENVSSTHGAQLTHLALG